VPATTYDAFISYAESDASFVRNLADALRRRGMRVWPDEGKLRRGDAVLRSLEHALKASRHFLLVISPDYLASSRGNFEMGVALAHGPVLPANRIIPLYTARVEPSAVPSPIADLAGLRTGSVPVDELALKVAELIKRGNRGNRAVRQKPAAANVPVQH
jgi:hypothetical protein